MRRTRCTTSIVAGLLAATLFAALPAGATKRTGKQPTDRILLPRVSSERAVREIGQAIVRKVLAMGKSGVVLGLSGGSDSTVVAGITKRAFDAYNRQNPDKPQLEVVGMILPSKTNTAQDTADGVLVAKTLGIRYEVASIEPLVRAFKKVNRAAMKNSFTKGNTMSELRAVVLHTKAASDTDAQGRNKFVIGTGNRDEDVETGFYTLFGDGAVHFSPIGNLSKRHVFQLARWFGFMDIARKEPWAGLEAGQTAFKALGYHYALAELVNRGVEQGFTAEVLARQPQVLRRAGKDLGDYQRLFGAPKYATVRELVDAIIWRKEHIAKPKGEIVRPEVAGVTLTYR